MFPRFELVEALALRVTAAHVPSGLARQQAEHLAPVEHGGTHRLPLSSQPFLDSRLEVNERVVVGVQRGNWSRRVVKVAV